MVESLQRGLQGHVSSVPRKGRTPRLVPSSGGSWGVPGVSGVVRRCSVPCQGISPRLSEGDGTECPAGLGDLPGAVSLPAGWQGDRGPC